MQVTLAPPKTRKTLSEEEILFRNKALNNLFSIKEEPLSPSTEDLCQDIEEGIMNEIQTLPNKITQPPIKKMKPNPQQHQQTAKRKNITSTVVPKVKITTLSASNSVYLPSGESPPNARYHGTNSSYRRRTHNYGRKGKY